MKKNKLMRFVAILVFVCMMLSISISLITIHRMSSQHTTDLMSELSENVCGSIEGTLTQTIDVARTIAHDQLMIELLDLEGKLEQDVINRKMSEYAAGLSDIFSYQWVSIISDRTGAYYLNDGLYKYIDPKNNPEDAWYTQIRDQDSEYVVMLGVDNDSEDKWILFVDTKIRNTDGDFLGICGIALGVDALQNILSDFEEKYDVEIFFVNEAGEIQLKSGEFSDTLESYDLSAIDTDGTVAVKQNGYRRDYLITRYLEELGWYMIIDNVDPYNYSADYLLIMMNIGLYVIFLLITAGSMRYMVRRGGNLYDFSYHDSLTGLNNRRSFDEEMNVLREVEGASDLAVAVFDINGLKKVNDTLGHASGDRLIKGCAHVIASVFSAHGTIYRTGGDEFVALLKHPKKDRSELWDELLKKASEWDAGECGALSISFGYAYAKDHPNASVDELYFIADEEMYQKKKAYYGEMETKRVQKT